MAEVYGPNRGIMVESSLPNVAQRHQFAQDEKAESIIIKPDDTAATAPDQQLEPPPHTPATSFNSEDLSSASPITVTSPIRLHHLQSYPANVSSPTANTDDVRHEEEDSAGTMTRSSLGEDPYVYSDDSASLSDAYFFPQPDDEHLARPPRYRTEVNSEATQTALLQYPLADYYGSMPSSSAVQVRATSPMWIAGSIQEDSEMSSSLGNPDVTSLRLHSANNDPRMKRRKERRQRRHRIHSRGILRQNSRNRELAVTAVRGRLQDPTKAHDVLWAVLFLLQLLVVFLCAIRFGCSLLYSGPETVTNSNVLHWRHIVPWHMQSSADAFTTQSIIQKAQFSDDFVVSPADATSLPPVARFSFTIDYKNVIALVSISGAYSCVITYLSYGFMLVLARALIQIMLIFSVLLALAWGLIGLTLDPYGVISIMGFTALLLTLGYAMYNWSSIPFAATNL